MVAAAGKPPTARTQSSMSGIVERIAIHESGHAVVALVTGLGVRFASIEVGREEVVTDWRRSRVQRPCIEERVMFHIAGWAAERRYAPALTQWHNSRDDFDRADELLQCRDAALLMRETDDLIRQHWPVVEVIARALLERTTLSGEEILEVARFAR